jgi:hypothetical protein
MNAIKNGTLLTKVKCSAYRFHPKVLTPMISLKGQNKDKCVAELRICMNSFSLSDDETRTSILLECFN